MGTSKNLASVRLVGIFSPSGAKNAENTMCICEYFGKEWEKRLAKMPGGGFFKGPLFDFFCEIKDGLKGSCDTQQRENKQQPRGGSEQAV